jgi:hypothetical protein
MKRYRDSSKRLKLDQRVTGNIEFSTLTRKVDTDPGMSNMNASRMNLAGGGGSDYDESHVEGGGNKFGRGRTNLSMGGN